MNFQIKIEDKVVCTGTVAKSISEQDFVAALMKVVDRFTSIRECDINIKARPTMDALWVQWLEAISAQYCTTMATIMGNNRSRPLPTVRALAIAAWIDATNETQQRVSLRMGMHHTSIIAAIDRLNDNGKHDKVLRQQHFDAIAMCQAIIRLNIP